MKMKKYYSALKARADCSANDKSFTTLVKKVGKDVGYF